MPHAAAVIEGRCWSGLRSWVRHSWVRHWDAARLAIAAVSTLGCAGFVVGPPCTGALSAVSGSLPRALAPVAAFGVATALGAGAVERSR